MTELAAIPAKMKRSTSDLEQLCKMDTDRQLRVNQPVHTAGNEVLKASLIASRLLPQSYNSAVPDSKQQGVLHTLHDLHKRVAEYTGYPEISLAAHDYRQALFASLAMTRKYHQHKHQRRSYVLLCNVMPALADIIRDSGYEPRWVEPECIEQQIDDQCAAIVVSLQGLQDDWSYLESVRASLDDWDIPLIADGSEQYFLPEKHKHTELKADILHLDLAYICGLNNGVNAVLCDSRFAPYLPLPVTAQDDKGLRWLSMAERPNSIGPLYSSPVNLQAAMHCLVYMRLQGNKALQQQALQSMVLACYLHMKLSQAGFDVLKKAGASGDLTVSLADTEDDRCALRNLLAELVLLPLRQRLVLDKKQQKLHFSVTWLHQLSLKQVDQLLEMFILHLGKKT